MRINFIASAAVIVVLVEDLDSFLSATTKHTLSHMYKCIRRACLLFTRLLHVTTTPSLSLYSNCQNSQKTQEAQISCEKHYGGKEGRAHNNKYIILGRRGCLTYSTLSGYLIMSRWKEIKRERVRARFHTNKQFQKYFSCRELSCNCVKIDWCHI
jgi:hypothetical protein